MKKIKSHFMFNKQERSGIFFLLLFIILYQIAYFLVVSLAAGSTRTKFFFENQVIQDQINGLKQKTFQKDTLKMHRFNPNFITDFKGYTLGMSIDEIDRLHAFRASNTYVNSSQEFQEVTLVSDSLLQTMAPYFKFPEWSNEKRMSYTSKKSDNLNPISQGEVKDSSQKREIKDLNLTTAEELKAVSGIGDILSERIIKFRDRLGGFLVDDQLMDVYGLELQVVERVKEKFSVLTKPQIKKININRASALEISKLIYLNYAVSKNIVDYREENNGIHSFDELIKIAGFPSEKINRISLYLSLKESDL